MCNIGYTRGVKETIGAVCHHTSQPLQAALGSLELLLFSPDLNIEQTRYVNDALDALNRAAKVLLLLQTMDVDKLETEDYPSAGAEKLKILRLDL